MFSLFLVTIRCLCITMDAVRPERCSRLKEEVDFRLRLIVCGDTHRVPPSDGVFGANPADGFGASQPSYTRADADFDKGLDIDKRGDGLRHFLESSRCLTLSWGLLNVPFLTHSDEPMDTASEDSLNRDS